MNIRPYNPKTDREAVIRIWKEIGWLEKEREEGLDCFLASSRAYVAEVEGSAESLVTAIPGTMRYLHRELSLAAIGAVTTSRIARQQGFAKYLTAKALAHEVSEGAVVSVLGMFEQGFYNRIGYGTGSYEHWVSFDPNYLKISFKPRIPKRLGREDYKEIHHSMLHRLPLHGSCNLLSEMVTKGELLFSEEKDFGLGYYNDQGHLTHHFFCSPQKVEHGPYSIRWLVFQNYHQFLELMALLKSLGDQVRLLRMREPRGIQLQDFLEKPLQKSYVSQRSEFPSIARAVAYWQTRILDLEGALSLTHLLGDEVSFNLALTDPISKFLPSHAWNGVEGEYIVTLGPTSRAIKGWDDSLPILKASVDAFSRLWLGVLPARSLAVTDDLKGPEDLLEDLERILRLPLPSPDWDF